MLVKTAHTDWSITSTRCYMTRRQGYLVQKNYFFLIISAQYLKPYFQAHLIIILTNQLLRVILSWLDTSRCLATWVIKLNEFKIILEGPGLGQLLGKMHVDEWRVRRSTNQVTSVAIPYKDHLDPLHGWCIQFTRKRS